MAFVVYNRDYSGTGEARNGILNRSEKEWRMPPREWVMAKAQFAVLFGERFTRAMAA